MNKMKGTQTQQLFLKSLKGDQIEAVKVEIILLVTHGHLVHSFSSYT